MENIKNTNYSELKEQAEVSLSKAKNLILASIPNEEIISIYVKGSYVQDALRPDSDVDVVVILKTEEYLPAVYKLTEEFGNTTNPPFQAVAYTLRELQTGEKASNRTVKSTSISPFVKHLDQLPLLYGSKPEGTLFTRTDIKDLTAFISAFEKMFLPDFEKGTFTFAQVVKQVLWLAEREQRALGIIPDYSWQKLADSIEDKNHIIHSALAFRRRHGKISNDEKDVFMSALKEYLRFLKEKYTVN
jgi:predicted nucleotidyltransferase